MTTNSPLYLRTERRLEPWGRREEEGGGGEGERASGRLVEIALYKSLS